MNKSNTAELASGTSAKRARATKGATRPKAATTSTRTSRKAPAYRNQFESTIIGIERGIVRGWIVDRGSDHRSIAFQLVCDGVVLGQGKADQAPPEGAFVAPEAQNARWFSVKLDGLPAALAGRMLTVALHDTDVAVKCEGYRLPDPNQTSVDILGLEHNVLRFSINNCPSNLQSAKLALFVDGRAAGVTNVTILENRQVSGALALPTNILDGAVHVFQIQPLNFEAAQASFAGITRPILTPWVHLKNNWQRAVASDTVAPPEVVSGQKALLRTARTLLASDPVAESRFRALEALTGGTRIADFKDAPLVFPETAKPAVSVVIPVYNQFDLTIRCLCSLLVMSTELEFEVIIGDDGSKDQTREIERYARNITVVRGGKNKGFVGNCNQAARRARGQFILFLNNDTEVADRLLDELVAPFDRDETVGVTGAKLVSGDGTLQEAGGIVWRSGQPWNCGRGTSPYAPEWNYYREVDYVSGAALLIRKDLWKRVGGFSEEFAPGYYEDTDLAFKVREAGYKVSYAPLAVVKHLDGASSANQADGGMKRHQEPNAKRFRSKWSRVFRQNNAPEGVDLNIHKDRGIAIRALVIDAESPMGDRSAGGYAALQEIRAFQDLGIKVTFAPDNMAYFGRYTEDLQRMGVECIYAPYVRSIEDFLRARGGEFDFVYITRYAIAEKHIPAIRSAAPHAKIVLNNADMHFLRELRQALSGNGDLSRAVLTRDHELQTYRNVDLVLMYSDVERGIALSHILDNKRIAATPWVAEVPEDLGPDFADRGFVTFIGGFRHYPNVLGVRWLHDNVLPLVRNLNPNIKFMIVGADVPSDIEAYDSEDFQIVGYVDKLSKVMDKTRVLLAPLFVGAGVEGKVIEAMANAIPIVTTGVGAEGLPIANGINAFVADTAEDFAQQIATIYADADRWQSVRDSALETVRTNFSRERAANTFRRILREVDVYL